MTRKLDSLSSEARRAGILIKNFQGPIRVVSHYDADGIASAAIMSIALSREAKQFRLTVVKQLSEKRIKELAQESNMLILFTDLGSGYIKLIEESLPQGAKAVILDHHQIKDAPDAANVIHVNPLLHGINENLSGAGVTYLLAKEMDPENIDLSYLGVVGAVGDSQMGSIEEGWGLYGPNKEILMDARKCGKIEVSRGLKIWGRRTRPLHKALEYCTDPFIPGVSGSESAAVQFLAELGIPLRKKSTESTSIEGGKGEDWRTLGDLSDEEQRILASGIIEQRIGADIKKPHDIFGDIYEIPSHPETYRSVDEFATVLNACGKLGKHYTGISMCMGSPDSFREAEDLLLDYRKGIGKAISWVNRNKDAIRSTDLCTYMIAGSRVSEHIISNLASIFNKSGFVPDSKPVFAFADTEEGMIKVSGRAHDLLVENGINMEKLVSEAASRSGGEGGGHKAAAGATIPRESQEVFISYIEEILDRRRTEAKESPSSHADGTNNINIKMPEHALVDLEGRRQNLRDMGLTPSVKQFGVTDGTAERQAGNEGGGGEKASGDAFKPREAAPGIRQAPPAEGSSLEKMEGQGLVRYFGPKNVQ